jgi:hypothetical protein
MTTTTLKKIVKRPTVPAVKPIVSTINHCSASCPTLITHWPNDQYRRHLIAQIAYGRAEKRGLAPGHEVDDWLAAEVEVETLLEGWHYSGD